MPIEVHTNVNPVANIQVSTTSDETPTIDVNVPEAAVIALDTTVLLGPKGDKGDKGDTGNAGVEISTTEPTDPAIKVWLDPSGTQGKLSQLTNDVGFITASYHDNTKQDVISDLSTIRSNASSALQPNDNITELTNNAGYQNGSQVSTAITTVTEPIQSTVSTIQTEVTSLTSTTSTLETSVTSIQTTIGNYGDVVSHNASEFYLATNPSGYQTAGQVTTAITNSIINNVTSTSTTSSLSANMGKELQDQITNLKQRGRYLSIWNCTTGLATTEPTVNPYTYKAGDYFIIGVVGATNYKPNGSTYDKTVASTTVETGDVQVNDTYYYDGTSWSLLHTQQPTVAFGTLAGSPYDNTNLTTALNAKYDASNPNGYTSNTGTITGITMNGTSKGTSGVVDLGTVITSLSGYATETYVNSHHDSTKYDASNPSGYISGITSTMVTTALGYTPYNSTNPSGYQTGSQVTTAITTATSNVERTTNRVTTVTSSSTNTQYPSAKCVYDIVGNIESALDAIRGV